MIQSSLILSDKNSSFSTNSTPCGISFGTMLYSKQRTVYVKENDLRSVLNFSNIQINHIIDELIYGRDKFIHNVEVLVGQKIDFTFSYFNFPIENVQINKKYNVDSVYYENSVFSFVIDI